MVSLRLERGSGLASELKVEGSAHGWMLKLSHLVFAQLNLTRDRKKEQEKKKKRRLCPRINVGSIRHLLELGSRSPFLHGLQQTEVLLPHVVVEIVQGVEGRPHPSEL